MYCLDSEESTEIEATTMYLQTKQYCFVLSNLKIKIPTVFIILIIIVLEQYSCKEIHGVDSVENISASLNFMNFTGHVLESVSDMYPLPGVSNGPYRNNTRSVKSTNKTQVPLANYKNSTNKIGVIHQQLKPSNYSVLTLVRNIDIRLKSIRNVELGLATIQEIFDVLQFSSIVNKTNETLFQFSKRLTEKLEKASKSIFQMKRFFERNVTSILNLLGNSHAKDVVLDTVILPCPLSDIDLEPNYNKQQIKILNYLKHNNRTNESNISNTVNYKMLDEFEKLNIDSNNFKQIFYLSTFDHATDRNCMVSSKAVPFRWLYASAVPRKCIFILFDIGSTLTVDQMELSKTFVSNIVRMLGAEDMISIITLSDEVLPMTLIGLHGASMNMSNMYSVGPENKEEIIEYISGLKRSSEMTNHTIGFEYAFSLLGQYNLSKHYAFEFIYVTRGLLRRLSDARSVLTVIARGQQHLSHPVVINACAVILDEKRIMYEKQFLTDIVNQNYSKYEIDVSTWNNNNLNLKGNLYIITKRHPEKIIRTSTAVFTDLFLRYVSTSNNLYVHHPTIDYNSRDVVVPMIHAIPKFGVVGVNLYLSDLAEDVINYKNFGNSYACLIDTKGFAIVHPALQNSITSTKIPAPVDIAYLEKSADFLKVRKCMLNEDNGNVTISFSLNGNVTKTYTWNRVMEIYIVCIITTVKPAKNNPSTIPYQSRFGSALNKFQHTEYSMPIDLLYHRIDLIPPRTPVCRYFRQIATLDTGTVFLSASSFQSPFTYLKNSRLSCDRTRTHTAQSIMAYIKDNTGLLANPGLLPRIRSDVNVLYNVMEHLKKRHMESSELKNYIIRRYAATISGVVQVYPGCVLSTDLEPSERPWFQKAIQHAGRIVITEPYLDAGGAGYVLTIAHTIFEGKANALHNYQRDSPVAIIALDVPYAFFYKILLDSSVCQDENIKCILFENEGYLIAHPSMMEPVHASKNTRRPREHLTHKESFLANDILNHKNLVTKLACANYQNRTIQRYYAFNTSLTDVLTNVVHGERTKYQITAVLGTNIFAAVLNFTCDGGAFCPCSTVDRVCLNCKRMDQTDCECPCECPMHIKSPKGLTSDNDKVEFLDSYLSHPFQYGYCETPTESILHDSSSDNAWNMVLNSCIHLNCDMYVTHIDCLAVMGCEWCQIDLDGNPFTASFCTNQNSCFNGVINSVSPYGDGEFSSTINESSKPKPYSTVGPVAGAIIVLCLVIGFAMYCYRHSLETGDDQFYVDSAHDDNYGVPLSRFNFDNVSGPDDEDIDSPGDGHGAMYCNLVHPVGNAIAVPDISPYHMSIGSSYRRPPNGESDHGYSTMTPHEDSEHMCFTLAEPLINNKRLSKSDSLSVSTSISSPTNQNAITADRPVSSMGVGFKSSDQRNNKQKHNSMFSQTVLGDYSKESDDQQQLNLHHILARVTVHRHMEAL